MHIRTIGKASAVLLACTALPALARNAQTPPPPPPADLLPPAVTQPTPVTPTPAPKAAPAAVPTAAATPVVQPTAPTENVEPVMHWPLADARRLLAVIEGIGAEGLDPADYQHDALRSAMLAGESPALDEMASKSFGWLVEDLRDGRTPMSSRVQWFTVDLDVDTDPTDAVEKRALESHDIAGTLAALNPTHPDYAILKAELATTLASDKARRATIRANMDRWRWLSRDLGVHYLITNVPEYQLRLTVKDKIVRTYRTIVGKPGKTATPQLAETVEGVIFNPTWTVPQSIVKGEGLGARLLKNPASAKREGYAVNKTADGMVNVVQQPGPNNSLGLMKLDMPNPHAIFLHDTPARNLFNANDRALSHGCIRTERATELAITLSILQAGLPVEEGVALSTSGKYTRVPFTKTLPVYITYFTMARDIEGKLSDFKDIYGRDAPILASLGKPRQLKTSQRTSNEAVVALEDPGV